MSISETVKSAAEAIACAKRPQSARHRLLVEILRLMPLYRDIHDLSAWDMAFRGALEKEDDDSELGLMLWDVFDFARLNMYASIDAAGTVAAYDQLADSLRQVGVKLAPPDPLTEW